MILKGSQRGGAKQLGRHLLKTAENEHVEVHELSGFMASDLLGALREAEAISKGTRCKQFLFSVSLNPPERESVRPEVFETALAAIEERNGLSGQPRVVVFHEKEGRRHCHAVWSRIDPETMTARPLPFFKTKLREVSKQIYLENGWQMPRGLRDSKERDPRNFTLSEWQQAKRAKLDARDLKGAIQECWAVSDNRASFAKALEERGLFLAPGDRRSHVALTHDGEVFSIPRMIGKKTKEVAARLGPADDLRSVDETKSRIAHDILPRIKSYLAEARQNAVRELGPLDKSASICRPSINPNGWRWTRGRKRARKRKTASAPRGCARDLPVYGIGCAANMLSGARKTRWKPSLPSSATASSAMRWCRPSFTNGSNYRGKSARRAPVMPDNSVISTRMPPIIASCSAAKHRRCVMRLTGWANCATAHL